MRPFLQEGNRPPSLINMKDSATFVLLVVDTAAVYNYNILKVVHKHILYQDAALARATMLNVWVHAEECAGILQETEGGNKCF